MRAGDEILHIPSNETWTIAAISPDETEIVCCGWPETIAKISDCRLIKSCSYREHIFILSRCLKNNDLRASWARENLKKDTRQQISSMLNNQASFIEALNIEGIPKEFIDKHNIEITILRHAAKVVLRDDLDWNACALDEMEEFISERQP